MDAIFLSSGDVIADRRFEWARDLADQGDLAAAADLLTQVLELVPRYAAAWFALGDAREKLGDRASAIVAFEQAKAADPADAHGAVLRLARLGAKAAAMPETYVRTLFDGYASGFDAALTQGLSYRALRHWFGRRGVPAVLRDANRRRPVAGHADAGEG
jgi:predicted TPR repeat methyltransferase